MGPAILVGFGLLLALASVWVWRATRTAETEPEQPQQYASITAAPVPYAVMVEEKETLDVVPFLGGSNKKDVWRGYKCPKCLFHSYAEVPVELEMKLCACSDYAREHFHFECLGCGYVAIMKTADDHAPDRPTVRRSVPQSAAVKCN